MTDYLDAESLEDIDLEIIYRLDWLTEESVDLENENQS